MGGAGKFALQHGLLLVATLLAASGQVLFKLGVDGRTNWQQMVNPVVLGGLVCYGLGTVLWILALSKLPLKVVYPYTALTFVFVYVAATIFLDERMDVRGALGVGCVLIGLFLLTGSRTA